jgi:ABC-type polysaccharide/polyol phosphate transport system ATPase subunit
VTSHLPSADRPQDSEATVLPPVAIELQGVRKAYKVYDRGFGFLREVLTGKPCHQEKPVLHDVSLEIRRGEVVGIIGRNGAGKSTLLKLIAGTLAPTAGKLAVSGRVSAILELGTGFNPAYSGRDNVIMAGLMRGMSEADIRRKFDAIVAFSGLEEVIDEPFQTYSSGMQARLAFAAAVSAEADVIIIDEALAAGDVRFAARSLRRIREICESGVTALFVSHTTYQVMQLCTRAIWIDGGRVRMDGPPIDVVRAYEYQMHKEIASDQEQASEVAKRADAEESFRVTQRPLVPASADSTSASSPPGQEAELLSISENANGGWNGLSVEPAPTAIAHAEHVVPQVAFRVLDLSFLNETGMAATAFRVGDRLRIRVIYERFARRVCGVTRLAITFCRAGESEPIMHLATQSSPIDGEPGEADLAAMAGTLLGRFEVTIDPIQLKPDEYTVCAAVAEETGKSSPVAGSRQNRRPLRILANGFPEPSVFYPLVHWANGPIDEPQENSELFGSVAGFSHR